MDNLILTSTTQTPSIDFDALTGVMRIQGRCIPDAPDEFWLPVLNWFESYLLDPVEATVFKIDLEYFNISSSKRILFLLYKLNELADAGRKVCVQWRYKDSDEDMFEVGQDYAYMVKVPFDFVEYSEKDLALAI